MRLSRSQLGSDPVRALRAWIDEARQAGLGDEPVFTLATIDGEAPDARLVVVRTLDEQGLTFFADTRSPKGRQLAADPRATMVAYWPQLARQVRVHGHVRVLSPAECDAAFGARPRRSQLGYWANEQSSTIAGRRALERQLDAVLSRFEGREIPRPNYWVVYSLQPEHLEFWQSGERHLHDRIAYSRTADGSWRVERLQP